MDGQDMAQVKQEISHSALQTSLESFPNELSYIAMSPIPRASCCSPQPETRGHKEFEVEETKTENAEGGRKTETGREEVKQLGNFGDGGVKMEMMRESLAVLLKDIQDMSEIVRQVRQAQESIGQGAEPKETLERSEHAVDEIHGASTQSDQKSADVPPSTARHTLNIVITCAKMVKEEIYRIEKMIRKLLAIRKQRGMVPETEEAGEQERDMPGEQEAADRHVKNPFANLKLAPFNTRSIIAHVGQAKTHLMHSLATAAGGNVHEREETGNFSRGEPDR
eukprot:767587-Hanusia_phi.AAC.1